MKNKLNLTIIIVLFSIVNVKAQFDINNAGLVQIVPNTLDWESGLKVTLPRMNSCAYHLTWNGRDRIYSVGSGYVAAEKGFWTFSDINLKENIKTIDEALNKVKQLRGVYFNYKPESLCAECTDSTVNDSDTSRQMGLIAQEVQGIVPEVVRDQYTGYKAVAYQHLVGLLIEAIKELDTKINQCCGYAAQANAKNTQLGKSALLENTNLDDQRDINILLQNNPNPTTGKTNISYKISTIASKAEIILFDMQGGLIKKYNLNERGKGSIEIGQGELKAGMYLYSLVVDNKEIDTKRMIVNY